MILTGVRWCGGGGGPRSRGDAAAARPKRISLSGGRRLLLGVSPSVHPPDPYAAEMAAAMRVRPGDRVLDMGCGAGVYGLSAALRGAGRVLLTDTDLAAVDCALGNAARNGLPSVEGRAGPLFEPARGERFDVVMSSLPQLPAPRSVIATRYGGRDGLRHLRDLSARAAGHLAPGGRLYIIVTDWVDPRRVVRLFERRGFLLRCVCRVERAFQPAEYDGILPGLFAYLDRRASRGLARYRRAGSWCYLGVKLFEARRVKR